MKNLHDFSEKKEAIINAYKEIFDSNILPVEYEGTIINNKTIEEWMNNLKQEKFIVSICGQIKVGKSTFLNDLIFDNLVLPSASTPETAKLTEIHFGEPSYCAEFYSLEEWENFKKQKIILDNGKESNYYQEYLKPEINKIMEKTKEPIYPQEILSKKEIKGSNFKELKEYVSANGLYTPFVRNVKLYYNSEILKGITIVDTPGTNDPNEMRAKITEDWIGKSDAVIFIMFSGQPFTIQDEKFIKDFLLPVPTEKIIIGLSKIDVVEDYSRSKEYVENSLIRSNMEGFSKSIKEKNIYPISPMFSLYPKLYRKFENDEIELNEDEVKDINYQLNKRAKSNNNIKELIKNEGLMPQLKIAIEEHLIKNKGQAILISHSKKILSILEYKKKSIELKKNKINDKINIINLSEDELRKKSYLIEDAVKNFERVKIDVNAKKDKLINNITNGLEKVIFQYNNTIKDSIINLIRSKDIDYLIKNLDWDAKDITEKYFRNELYNEIDKVLNNGKNESEDIQIFLKEKIINFNLFSTSYIELFFSNFETNNVIKEIEYLISQNMSVELLKNLKVSKYIFFTDKENTKYNFERKVKDIFSSENGIKNIFEGVIRNIKNNIETLFTYMLRQLEKEIQEQDRLLRALEEDKSKFDKEIQLMKNEINKFDKEIQRIDNKIEDLNIKIG